jgi:hypothetical protein
VTATGTEISEDVLRRRIEELEQELLEVEREIGAATVDGRSITGLRKRAREASEGIRADQAALKVLQRRRGEAAEEAARGEASRERAETYEALVLYLELVEVYTLARDAFDAAEKDLREWRVDPRFASTKSGYGRCEESGLDTGLIGASPIAGDARYQRNGKSPSDVVRANLQQITPERARALRALAIKRADEERSGSGVDRSQPRDSWNAEQRERFEAELAEAAQRESKANP